MVNICAQACEVRRKDKEVSVLFCFTCADQIYEQYEDEAREKGGSITAAQLFTQNFEIYKNELLDTVAEAAGDAEQLAYISSHMYACCFKTTLQNEKLPLAQKLEAVEVKNVDWVKHWCLEHLLRIERATEKLGPIHA
jgi:hypothetical protein